MTAETSAAARRNEKLKLNVERAAVAAYTLIGVGVAAAAVPAISAAQALWGVQPGDPTIVRLLAAVLGICAVLIAATLLIKVVVIERDERLRRIGDDDEESSGLPTVHIQRASDDMYFLGHSSDTMWVAHRNRIFMRYRFFTSWTLSRLRIHETDPAISVAVEAPLDGAEDALRQRLTQAYRRAESYATARNEQEATASASA